jgi:CTP:molybdopterin cytidylyltransferase MocA
MVIWMVDPIDAPLYEAVVMQLGDTPEVRPEPPVVRVVAPHLPRSFGRAIWKLLKEDSYVPLQFSRDLVERQVARDMGRAPADPIANWRAFRPESGRRQKHEEDE